VEYKIFLLVAIILVFLFIVRWVKEEIEKGSEFDEN